jgi:hypothetical protein
MVQLEMVRRMRAVWLEHTLSALGNLALMRDPLEPCPLIWLQESKAKTPPSSIFGERVTWFRRGNGRPAMCRETLV